MITVYDYCVKYFQKSSYKMSKIIEYLYLGNVDDANNERFLDSINCKIIFNCTKDCKCNSNGRLVYRIPVNDDNSAEAMKVMSMSLIELIPKIETYIDNHNTVFIHCYAGMQRSAIVVLTYLVYRLNKIYNSNYTQYSKNYLYAVCKNYMLQKRPIVFAYGTSVNFERAFNAFCKVASIH